MSEISSIYCSRLESYKKPFGAVKAGDDVEICIYPRRNTGVLYAEFIIKADNENELRYIPMKWNGYEGYRDCYKVSFEAGDAGLYWYAFKIITAYEEYYIVKTVGGRGDVRKDLSDMFQLTVFNGDYKVADWFGQGITYNIFPDRFCRTEVPKKTGWRTERNIHENWSDIPVYLPDEKGEIWNNDFFGGSIKGVISKLDYLKSLNVKTIYFNPIFEAFSNHRYDTGNYKNIDPMMGTEEDFKELCSKAKEYGMRVVLDGVFSHTGYDSEYFNARNNYDSVGAYQSKDSKYYSWYDFSEWPNKYSSWWGIYTLPQVNEMNQAYLDYIIEGEDSVIKHWLNAGASGWRLDVADELPDEFIAKLNAAARSVKEDALVIGEVWEDASNKISYDVRRKYFQGGELDSVMNYPLRDGILAYLCGASAEDFVERMETLRENYPTAVFYNLMNIISTHDTPRALTLFGANPSDWSQSRDFRAYRWLEGEEREMAKYKLFMAAIIQFTMPGSPTIYYGDEAGQQGYEDPFNRRTYPWGNEDTEILEFYKKLGNVRSNSKALNKGQLRFLEADNDILIYERQIEDEQMLILVNRGYETVCYAVENANEIVPVIGQPEIFIDENELQSIALEPQKAYIVKIIKEDN